MIQNALVHADATVMLRDLSQRTPSCIDLAYVDPPFNVGVEFAARTGIRESRGRRTQGSGPFAYADRWGGIDGFVLFLTPVIGALRDCLSPTGIFWLHLDYRGIHEAKVLCDRVFGRGAFRGEVIWAPGNGARRKRGPSVTHQTLLIYTRDARPKADFVWNCDDPALREPYASTSLSMHFRFTDDQGRRYRDRVIGGKTYRYYADEGRRPGSVWTDIPAMTANTPIHAEGTGYPTQKPEKLLERVILLSSDPGALVCDPMCGSGTTLAVAGRLQRNFVGSDASPLAIETANKRLSQAGLVFDCSRLETEPPPQDDAQSSTVASS